VSLFAFEKKTPNDIEPARCTWLCSLVNLATQIFEYVQVLFYVDGIKMFFSCVWFSELLEKSERPKWAG
jgi:hypothetical protein